jgi:hypothetical protein
MARLPVVPEDYLTADARVQRDVGGLDLRGLTSTPTLPPASDPTRDLMDAISRAEGTGDDAVRAGGKFNSGYDMTFGNNAYGAPQKPISQMTLDEVDRYQHQVFHNPANHHRAAPVGRYQFLQSTLQGLRRNMKLRGDEVFSPELQDRMVRLLIQESGLSRYQTGRITPEQFQDGLATRWDSIAAPATGKTKHGGRLGMTSEQAQALISGFPRGQ